jgi:DNA-binding CsgD family transcriptional regulator
MLSTDTIEGRLDTLRELAAKEMTYNEISEEMALSYSTVYSLARDNHITVGRKSKVDRCLPEIEKLAGEGISKKDIAEKLNLSNSSVTSAMKRHGITVNKPAKDTSTVDGPKGKRLSQARLERLAQVEHLFVKEGLNAAEIARKFNVSREMIRQDLTLMDITSSEVNEAQRAKQSEAIKELAAEGLVTSEIAEKLEMTAHTVRSIAKKYDIAIQRLKPVDHGTFLSYQRGCTCQPCKDANTASARKQKEKRLLKEMPEELHGTDTGYRNWGCPCDRCKAAGVLKNQLSTSTDNPKERNFAIWTPEEDAIVVDYTFTARDLALKLDRSIPAVNARRATLKKAHPES